MSTGDTLAIVAVIVLGAYLLYTSSAAVRNAVQTAVGAVNPATGLSETASEALGVPYGGSEY